MTSPSAIPVNLLGEDRRLVDAGFSRMTHASNHPRVELTIDINPSEKHRLYCYIIVGMCFCETCQLHPKSHS